MVWISVVNGAVKVAAWVPPDFLARVAAAAAEQISCLMRSPGRATALAAEGLMIEQRVWVF